MFYRLYAALCAACLLSLPSFAQTLGIENQNLRASVDLDGGDIHVTTPDGEPLLRGTAAVGLLRMSDPGYVRRGHTKRVRDDMGAGWRLSVECRGRGLPRLHWHATLYDDEPGLVLGMGMTNNTDTPVTVESWMPLDGARYLAPGALIEMPRNLNAPSGAHQTRVADGLRAVTTNNLLLTWLERGERRSLLAGGLRTAEFAKSVASGRTVALEGHRAAALEASIPGAELVAYADWGPGWQPRGGGVQSLRLIQGSPWAWAGDDLSAVWRTVAFHEQQVIIEAEGLDPDARYALGYTLWDGDSDGRVESVWVEGPSGWRELASAEPLPSATETPRERAVVLPPEATRAGTVRVAFRNEAQVPNATVSESWLWRLDDPELPSEWRDGRPAGSGGAELDGRLTLVAWDPLGRTVRPGETWMPADTFYVDPVTADPFEGLERYGRLLARVHGADPTPYTFPTVCSWYAGVWGHWEAQNHPELSLHGLAHTAGLVEEAEWVVRRGFHRYSPVGLRVVPDLYEPQNPQGWWDSAHWRRYGYYTEPYATSASWGKALRERECLAFTYCQPDKISADFRAAHPSMFAADDPARALDPTDPATAGHVRGAFERLRYWVPGVMFDYCDDFWSQLSAAPRLENPQATATSAYRRFMSLAKQGLGERSWIHERSIHGPPADLAIGIVDSQRTSGDTDRIYPALVSRGGLRWYKNRVLFAYDMDSKDLTLGWKVDGYGGTDEDGRRMLLTMAYVAASRLLLANSFRDLDDATLHDLSRTYPYHGAPQSARPVDAFVHGGWPRVYDFQVTPDWHQLTLYNTSLPTREESISVPLSAAPVDGGLGLDRGAEYHVYDFWNDRHVGRVDGSGPLVQVLRPGEARMLSVHRATPHPQFISTDRHLMQGYVDLVERPRWRPGQRTLVGTSMTVRGEAYRVTVATNGWRAESASEGCRIEPRGPGLVDLVIPAGSGGPVEWRIRFKP